MNATKPITKNVNNNDSIYACRLPPSARTDHEILAREHAARTHATAHNDIAVNIGVFHDADSDGARR